MTDESGLHKYADTASWQTTDYAAISIKCGFLTTNEVNPFTESGQFGFGVSHDGMNIALIAGAHLEENDDEYEAFTHQSITPEQARELADTLNDVADTVDCYQAEYEERKTESEEGFLKRLISR